MAAVDLRFDQAEVWLLRNTFQVPRDLIPYILLPHHPQEGFSSYINKGEDEALMRELEGEITKVNSQREEIAMLDLVHERQIRRLKALKEVKSNLSQLLTAGGARGESFRQLKRKCLPHWFTQAEPRDSAISRYTLIRKQKPSSRSTKFHHRMQAPPVINECYESLRVYSNGCISSSKRTGTTMGSKSRSLPRMASKPFKAR